MTRALKRLIIGSPVSTANAGHALLPKKLALPIFASDALSSVAYATQEILLVLTLGGTAFFYLAPWIAAAVIILMIAVVMSLPPAGQGLSRLVAAITRSRPRTSVGQPGSSSRARCSSTT